MRALSSAVGFIVMSVSTISQPSKPVVEQRIQDRREIDHPFAKFGEHPGLVNWLYVQSAATPCCRTASFTSFRCSVRIRSR